MHNNQATDEIFILKLEHCDSIQFSTYTPTLHIYRARLSKLHLKQEKKIKHLMIIIKINVTDLWESLNLNGGPS